MSPRTAQAPSELDVTQPGSPEETATPARLLRELAMSEAPATSNGATTPVEREDDVPGNPAASAESRIRRLRPIFDRTAVPREFFVALQRFEGYVESIGETTFTARLVDLAGRLPEEEAEFFLDDVSEGDTGLMEPGAVFYWSLGYRVSSTRQRSKVSLLRFRRLPAWSERDIQRAQAEAERMLEQLRE